MNEVVSNSSTVNFPAQATNYQMTLAWFALGSWFEASIVLCSLEYSTEDSVSTTFFG
ncbi:uncharacterized protein AFUA_3G13190 [Aspergillus fumigatus Af293]|uniref:Uncharacterized protein n=2 Tax=Aspergillus fumigatus TaxID=746128 RepID=Q4WYI8_ASPFU|nr:hypothetical protein AFUA_3G13190 [Aspergillus fumigatus Af293]EAL92265.1 hypothetical protein AFUA_3G13190 [Aspergillus fumigatus Af293]EDP52435.1 hypothetical protein AFUB_036010 [Aspergillus fumigatus A1163]